MLKVNQIFEEDYILEYLESRNLVKQYKKSKQNILSGLYSWNRIWFKEPKKDWLIYFRINKQFRALCRLNWNSLIVFDIDNHQN